MYLSIINETIKPHFLILAKSLCKIDGVYDDKERATISAYCKEMGIADTDFSAKDLKETITYLDTNCSKQEKKIIVFELVGLACVNHAFTKDERELIHLASTSFNLSKDYVDDCEKLIQQYFNFQESIDKLVMQK